MGDRDEKPRFNAISAALAIGLATFVIGCAAAVAVLARVFISLLMAVQW